jgi:hypothetical protein
VTIGPPTSNYARAALDAVHAKMPHLDPDMIALYALLVIVKGEDASLHDVHDAWALWQATTNPDHRNLVPLEFLTEAQQQLDRPFLEAVVAIARELPPSSTAAAWRGLRTFREELTALLNSHCMDNASDTPDWILAAYLNACLEAFDTATIRRREWYGSVPDRDARGPGSS